MTPSTWKDAAQAELDALTKVHEQLGMFKWEIRQGFERAHVDVTMSPKTDVEHETALATIEGHWLSALQLAENIADRLAMAEALVRHALASGAFDPQLTRLADLLEKEIEPVMELIDGHLQLVPANKRQAVIEARDKMDATTLPASRAGHELASFAALAALAPIEPTALPAPAQPAGTMPELPIERF